VRLRLELDAQVSHCLLGVGGGGNIDGLQAPERRQDGQQR
jgi:hypothetical protein